MEKENNITDIIIVIESLKVSFLMDKKMEKVVFIAIIVKQHLKGNI